MFDDVFVGVGVLEHVVVDSPTEETELSDGGFEFEAVEFECDASVATERVEEAFGVRLQHTLVALMYVEGCVFDVVDDVVNLSVVCDEPIDEAEGHGGACWIVSGVDDVVDLVEAVLYGVVSSERVQELSGFGVHFHFYFFLKQGAKLVLLIESFSVTLDHVPSDEQEHAVCDEA